MKNVLVEGHRGYCAAYPENTLPSFSAAMDLGVDAVETDIWLSADGAPVLMHDGYCARTCGVGRHLRDMTLTEIKKLDAGFAEKFGTRFKGTTVPTFGELCALAAKKRPDLIIGTEIKEYTTETADAAVATLKEYALFENAIFYAFDAEIIRYLKEKHGARTMGYPDFQMKRWFEGAYRYYDEIGISMRVLASEVYAPIYAKKTFPRHIYCADTEAEVKTALAGEPSLITANDPVPLMRALGRGIGTIRE